MKSEALAKHLLEVRSRLSRGSWNGVGYDVGQRLRGLRAEVQNSTSPEMWRHAPVAAIAALETSFRGTVVDLVDRGEPFRARAADLLRDKIAVAEAISWFHGGSFTFGEVVARAVNCSSVSHILSSLGTLLAADVAQLLRTAVEPYARRQREPGAAPVISDVDVLLRDVEEAFRTRHIVAHEAALSLVLDRDGAIRAIDAVRQLKAGIEAMLWEAVDFDRPLSQFEINQHAYQQYELADAELRNVAARAAEVAKRLEASEWFAANQEAWQRLCRDWIEGAYLSSSGTMWPGVASEMHAALVRQRSEQLTTWISFMGDGDP